MTQSFTRMIRRALKGFAATFVFLPCVAFAATINVPSTATPTIQSGIDASAAGDTVLVAPGTYFENIDFKGKAITVTSSGGAAVTIINGGHLAPAVTFITGETRASILSNFTITAGYGLFGMTTGGIYAYLSSPTILSNVITANDCYGINSNYASPSIQSNEISYTKDVPGGCGFASGAGIWLDGDNLNVPSSLPEVVGNVIEQNTEAGLADAGGNGGAGIAVWAGSFVIANNTIRNNAAQGGVGGGINLYTFSGGLIVNNLISGNRANLAGGGVFVSTNLGLGGTRLAVINNTIVDNAVMNVSETSPVGQIVGGQQIVFDRADLILDNNIIGGSTAGPSVLCSIGPDNPVAYSHNDFYNDSGPVTGQSAGVCAYPSGTAGNISVDPSFVSNLAHDYHLSKSSVGVDTGDNAAVDLAMSFGFGDSTDLDAVARIQDAFGNGCTIDIGAYEYAGSLDHCSTTTETLVSSLLSANVGQSVSFTATVTSATGTPTGTIIFSDGTTTFGTQNLINGVATFTTSTLAVGTHLISAAYSPGGAAFSASTATLSQVINGLTTTTSLTVAPTTAVYGTNIVMTSAVNLSGSPNSTGGITFMDGATAIATGQLQPGSSTSTYNDVYLTVGTHMITAVYSGDATHNASTSPAVTVTITAAVSSLALTAAPNPAFTLQPITLTARLAGGAAGSAAANVISFFANGNTLGSATTDNSGSAALTVNLLAGTYSLTAFFDGTSTLTAITSAPVTEVVNIGLTATAVYAQPNPGYQGGNETLTASVTPLFSSGTPLLPTGTITFLDSGNLIANATLNAQGQATFSTTGFAVGTHSIVAVYHGTPNFSPSTSIAYPLGILVRDFSLTADPTLTIQTEHHKYLNVSLTSVGLFADDVALSCGNLPLYASCTFANRAPALGAGATLPFTVDVDTDVALHFLGRLGNMGNRPGRIRAFEAIGFALLLPITLLGRRRRMRFNLLTAITALAAITALTGCSSHYPDHTPPGTYSITVTGTGAGTHITHTATITLVITN